MLAPVTRGWLRRRAVAWLTLDGVYDAAASHPRAVCVATEKGLVARHFVLSEVARNQLQEYVRSLHAHDRTSVWLFPSRTSSALPIAPRTVNRILCRACQTVGVRGRHVHSHGSGGCTVRPPARPHAQVRRVPSHVGGQSHRRRLQVHRAPIHEHNVRNILGCTATGTTRGHAHSLLGWRDGCHANGDG